MKTHGVVGINMVERIEQKKTATLIFEQISKEIINGTLKPGEKLPSTKELARQFKVSNSSVREALQQLKAAGLINIQQGKGVFVNEELTPSLFIPFKSSIILKKPVFLELLQLREVIERETAFLAAKNATQEEIEELQKTLGAMEEAKRVRNIKEFVIQDIKFHSLVAKASRNSFFPSLLDIIHGTFVEQQEFVASLPGTLERSYKYHCKIYEAIKSKKPKESQRQMLAHLKDIKQRIKKYKEKIEKCSDSF